jgi:hypothetical protein
VVRRVSKVRINQMMSVHDALEAWQAGEITSKRALTDATNVIELYAFASSCGVEIRRELTAGEAAAAEAATKSVQSVLDSAPSEPGVSMP